MQFVAETTVVQLEDGTLFKVQHARHLDRWQARATMERHLEAPQKFSTVEAARAAYAERAATSPPVRALTTLRPSPCAGSADLFQVRVLATCGADWWVSIRTDDEAKAGELALSLLRFWKADPDSTRRIPDLDGATVDLVRNEAEIRAAEAAYKAECQADPRYWAREVARRRA